MNEIVVTVTPTIMSGTVVRRMARLIDATGMRIDVAAAVARSSGPVLVGLGIWVVCAETGDQQ